MYQGWGAGIDLCVVHAGVGCWDKSVCGTCIRRCGVHASLGGVAHAYIRGWGACQGHCPIIVLNCFCIYLFIIIYYYYIYLFIIIYYYYIYLFIIIIFTYLLLLYLLIYYYYIYLFIIIIFYST